MIAVCLVRDQPHYRRDAFTRGLTNAGYKLVTGAARPSAPTDLLVIWNRYGSYEAMADSWEAQGGNVLVAENGYIGKDDNGHQLYALAVHGHNGSGWWHVGDDLRWRALSIPLADWVDRPDGYALICGQRGIGSRSMASPANWHERTARGWRLGKVKQRLHPGNKPDPSAPKLDDDLRGARYCIVWSSSSGVKALMQGIPVVYDAPHWICEEAAVPLRAMLDKNFEFPSPDLLTALRQQALERMAWAQWTIAELETGLPFTLLRDGIAKGVAKW